MKPWAWSCRYWYPLTFFLSLAFQPTALIGLNSDLAMPQSFSVTAACKPSLFAYPTPLTTEKKEEVRGGQAGAGAAMGRPLIYVGLDLALFIDPWLLRLFVGPWLLRPRILHRVLCHC